MTILYWGRVTPVNDTVSGYRDNSDIGLLDAYFSFDKVRLFLLTALIAVAIIGATGIFIAQYGVDAWKSTVTRAKSLMVINFDTAIPANTPPSSVVPGAVQQQSPIIEQPDTLYICPSCGIIGHPHFNAEFVPICPYCGVVLNKIIQKE